MKRISIFFVMSLSAVCLAYSQADLNRDGIVDFSDFSEVVNEWLAEDMSGGVRDNLHSSIAGIRGLSDPIPLKILAHMDTAEGWNTSIPNIEFDATKSINGIQSLKITSPNGAMTQTGWVYLPYDFYTDAGLKCAITGCIGIWLYTDSNCADVETIEVQFLPDKSLAADYYRAVLVDNTWPKWSYVKDNWWLIMMNPLRFEKSGSVASWSKDQGIRCINIKLKSVVGAETHLWIGGIFCEDFPKAAIVLGWDGIYNNWRPDMIESRGWRGYMAAFGYKTWLGDANLVDVNTLKEWYNKGWDVFPHAWSLCSTDVNEAAIRADCTKSMQFMSGNGFHRGTFLDSSCGSGIGCTDAVGAREIAAQYKVASRGVWGSPVAYARFPGVKPPANVTTETPSWICADWYNMHDVNLSEVSLAAAKTYVDEAVLLDGIQCFHACGISDSGGLDIPESQFAEFLDHIKAYEQQGKLEVITFTEWLNMTLMRPGCMKVGEGGQIFINSNEYRRLF